ncbi:hypothetical protein J6590_069283 [Homalodisca vitripennis]|nr:hypothetical protein J6590_095661 [Homalodisca vitripennis]KAG8320417.1 hypothetical protein J6590_069278 [Homalodisca vitripennis]KAG8320422.1 hypothetical protein J6590_069283 [Homalodisca vitripennis]
MQFGYSGARRVLPTRAERRRKQPSRGPALHVLVVIVSVEVVYVSYRATRTQEGVVLSVQCRDGDRDVSWSWIVVAQQTKVVLILTAMICASGGIFHTFKS